MAGNSTRSGARKASRPTHGVAFLNALIALCVALILSFFLGFFVFARMISHETKKPPIEAVNQAAVDEEAEKAARARRKEQKAEAAKKEQADSGTTDNADTGTSRKHVQPGVKTANGPTLSPEEDGQKPETVDGAGSTPTRTDNGAPAPRTRASGDNVQTPGNPDAPTVTGDPAIAPPKTGLFKVQLGVFSTRAKAQEAADAASDKGVKTSIRVITRGERTLYRVHHSSYKDRQKAEAEVQKLSDLGLDATIVEPN